MLIVSREAQFQETQIFYILKVYVAQVRFADRERDILLLGDYERFR